MASKMVGFGANVGLGQFGQFGGKFKERLKNLRDERYYGNANKISYKQKHSTKQNKSTTNNNNNNTNTNDKSESGSESGENSDQEKIREMEETERELALGLTPEQHNEKCIQEFCMYLDNCCFVMDIIKEWADDPFFIDLYQAHIKLKKDRQGYVYIYIPYP